jgi:hypothetical protein
MRVIRQLHAPKALPAEQKSLRTNLLTYAPTHLPTHVLT